MRERENGKGDSELGKGAGGMWNRGREARRVSIGSIPGRPLERDHSRKRVFSSAKAPG